MSRHITRTVVATLLVGVVLHAPAALCGSRVSTQALRPAPSTTPRSMPRIAPDGDGGLYLAWLENGVYVQRFTRDGSIAPGWPAAGKLVSAAGRTDNLSIVADGARGAFIAWDAGDYYGSVALCHVGPGGGTALLSSSPRPQSARITPSPSSTRPRDPQKHEQGDAYPDIVPDGVGGVFFAYQHDSWSTGSTIVLQRFGPSITAEWASPAYVSQLYWSSYARLSPDGAGGVFVAWTDGYTVTTAMLSHVDASGMLVAGWPSGGIRICSGSYSQTAPGVTPDATGGALIAWADSRDATHDQVFAQHVTSDAGLGCSTEGSSVCSHPTDFGPNRFGWYGNADDRRGTTAADGLGGVLTAWVDHRAGDADVYAQRIDASGAAVAGWPVDGAPVCAMPGDQLLPAITSDGRGGAIVAWQDVSTGGVATLRWLKLDTGGSPATDLPADGVVISATPDPASPPSVCSDGAAGAFVAWVDVSGPVPDVMASHLFPDQVLAVPGGGHGTGSLALASANPVRSAFVASFTLRSSDPARLDVLDVGGRLVSRRDVGALGAGVHTLTATMAPLPAGVYPMRLTQGSESLSRRVVVIP